MTRKKVSTGEKLGGSKADGCRRTEAVKKIHPRRSEDPTSEKLSIPVTHATFPSKPVRFFPKEHRSSPFYDSRVYIPTIDDFFADTQQGSMLDEVKLLPLEDLASLMCGSEVFCLIKDTPLGTDLLHLSEELQEKHAELDLRLIAKAHSVRRHTLPLLLHEGCSLQETLAMDAEDVTILMECLLANVLRFFVLYSVHGLRDQVRVRVSRGGEVLYQLKHSSLQASAVQF
ncbi:unnamed protein product [Heligmosomoides polygyrus]|uniref:NR LBD domain-containing protein n=1 Tax=Heligmosomoides polygyrus TaxID=6339 RepID=A0A183GPY3_HELPZ|nr:unnamed protein product [Heligmosomoides polygyrus]